MDRLKRVSQFIQALSLAASAAAAQQASSWVERHKSLPAWLSLFVAILTVIAGAEILRLLLENVFESSRRLRRLLLSHQFIEGTWLDLSRAPGRPVIVGVAHIEMVGSTVRFHGDDFSVDGNRQGHYISDHASLEWPKMKYKYTYHVSGAEQLSNQGFGEAQFIPRNGPPLQYVGFHFDINEGRRVTYEGWRIEDPKLLAELDSPNTRREAVLEFLQHRLEYLDVEEKAVGA